MSAAQQALCTTNRRPACQTRNLASHAPTLRVRSPVTIAHHQRRTCVQSPKRSHRHRSFALRKTAGHVGSRLYGHGSVSFHDKPIVWVPRHRSSGDECMHGVVSCVNTDPQRRFPNHPSRVEGVLRAPFPRLFESDSKQVRKGGVEPPRVLPHRILSPARLPVPPLSRGAPG